MLTHTLPNSKLLNSKPISSRKPSDVQSEIRRRAQGKENQDKNRLSRERSTKGERSTIREQDLKREKSVLRSRGDKSVNPDKNVSRERTLELVESSAVKVNKSKKKSMNTAIRDRIINPVSKVTKRERSSKSKDTKGEKSGFSRDRSSLGRQSSSLLREKSVKREEREKSVKREKGRYGVKREQKVEKGERSSSITKRQEEAGRPKLSLQPSIFNLSIKEKPSLRNILGSPLCSRQTTPVKSQLADYLPTESRYQPLLQYSPDSVLAFSSIKEQELDESNLLDEDLTVDFKEVGSAMLKTNTSRVSEGNNNELMFGGTISTFDVPVCASFRVEESGLSAVMLSVKDFSFRVDYRPLPNEGWFWGNALVGRLRKFFKEKPLQLFYFFNQVMAHYSSARFRKFLLQREVKCYESEIVGLDEQIEELLKGSRPQEVLELVLLTKNSEGKLTLSLSGEDGLDRVESTDRSPWLVFGEFFRANDYYRHSVKGEIESLAVFLTELL